MQDIFGSVRRSVVFRPNPAGPEIGAGDGGGGGSGSRIVEKIGSCLRKSMVGFGLGGVSPRLLSSPPLPSPAEEEEDVSPPIRWRKGELIGCGAFGHVYMGMNLDSGELFAVKQVLIAKNTGSKERAQAHIRELEEEVKLLKNLSHPNIVRYIGTAREEESLNILLEFVPGGSISSLLGKFGSFPEAVIRMYTKQLLQGLEYLHQNGIIHRDIKGANILVDNKGCIRLADFGASKQVAKLATMTAAKSMKGTPYWMAPEVILQTGHSFSADIWSVGCTVIEMATGKPPWSQQYQEVAALFHIGSTKSHPPIPEHLSLEAKDFLSKCLQKEPSLRPTASDLLQHPFVRREFKDPHPMYRSSIMEHSEKVFSSLKPYTKNSVNPVISRNRPIWDVNINDDTCRLDDNFDNPPLVGSSFNPVAEPVDEWPGHFFDTSLEQRGTDSAKNGATSSGVEGDSDFRFPCELVCEGDEDDEVTETKIRAFLDEKALDLKKLQTPLYEEFFNSLNTTSEPCIVANSCEDVVTDNLVLPSNSSRSSSPSKAARGVSSAKQQVDNGNCCSPVRSSGMESNRILREIPSPLVSEWGELQDAQKEYNTISSSSSERRRKWKEELDRELEKEREKMMCRAVGVKTSPKDSGKGIGAAALLNRKVILDQRFRSSSVHDRQKK